MADAYLVQILVDATLAAALPMDGPLELGRQRAGEPPPFHLVPAAEGNCARLVIAPQHAKDETSRRHLTLTPLAGGVRVTNLSQAPLERAEAGAEALPPGASSDLAPPFAFALAPCLVRVLPAAGSADAPGIHSLQEPTLGPGSGAELSLSREALGQLQPAQMLVLLDGIPRALGVLQSAVGATDFLARASAALVDVVRLDSGRVLLRRDDAWQVAALHPAGDARDWRPSRHVLDRLLRDRAAVWQKPLATGDPGSASLALLDAVVAAPLLDRHNQVIGALYGERRRDSARAGRADHRVEALLVNLLAGGVATGLARLEQEQAALKANTLFEQFFGPDLARQLAADPGLLDGREADVTILFADVRSFSRHSERLGTAGTFRWINDVMQELSRCVRDEAGVLVDYIGDELMAMWGTPREQPDQAARAVRAGLAMHAVLPALDARWQAQVGEPLRLGIGLNSGVAQVGNTGSAYKFKYGPLGNTVNLASRVQGLTKYLRTGVLATEATRAQLDDAFIARRVVRARAVNLSEPVDLYEIEPAGPDERRSFFAASAAALEALERGDFATAARMAGALLTAHPGDGPSLLTLARASDALVKAGVGFERVWTPPGK